MCVVRYYLSWLTLVLVFACLSIQGIAQDTQTSFAYVEAMTSDSVSFIDPITQQISSERYKLPEGFSPIFSPGYGASLSPKGEWLATFVAEVTGAFSLPPTLHLWNLKTHETRFITSDDWVYVLPDFVNLAWSRDEQHIGLIIAEQPLNDASDTELYIYDLPTDQLIRVTEDTFKQTQIYWSADSSYLMTFTTPCLSIGECANELNMYRIEGAKVLLEQTLKLDSLLASGNYICDVKTSPDNRYVTFVSVCLENGGATWGFPSRLYLWDRVEDLLQPLTNFGVDMYESQNMASTGRYQYVWLNAQELFVGVDYQIGLSEETGTFQQALLSYHLPDVSAHVLSQVHGSNFIYNSITQQLFLSKILSPLLKWSKLETIPYEVASLTDNIVQREGDFQTQLIPSGNALPAFCDSFISLDGEWVALTLIDANGGCNAEPTQLTFMSLSSPQQKHYTVSAKEGSFLIPLGWTSQ